MDRLQELLAFFAALLSGMIGLVAQDISFAAIPLQVDPPHTTVLFVGDMMFDRSVRAAMRDRGADFVFSCMLATLSQPDMVVGNLEGPITSNPSKSIGSAVGSHDNFVFTFPEYVASLLYRSNVRAVSLGNNHILNFGEDGVRQTTAALEHANVGYFGEPGGRSVFETSANGVALSFIGYNAFDSGWNASTTLTQIADARAKGRIPVVFAHWGEEYKQVTADQRALAHRFVDAGAGIVVGAHPHVIQESETYKGMHIYYSLGNFIFDQYWNADVRTGLTVSVTFGANGVEQVNESHVTLEKDRRTCPQSGT
jgi:poly-gamma-glutamate synthesis protein (capsule biosynthesis protein)